jgi:hypothetical protein
MDFQLKVKPAPDLGHALPLTNFGFRGCGFRNLGSEALDIVVGRLDL